MSADSALQPHVHFVPFWERSPTDVLAVLENATRHDSAMRRLGLEGSRLAHRLLNAHARQCYWRALLGLYASRLQRPPSLSSWPRAQPARDNWREGWHRPGNHRTRPSVDWGRASRQFRERDVESLRRVLAGLEADLAVANRRRQPRRESQSGRAPGDGSGRGTLAEPEPEAFLQSEVERRSPRWSSWEESTSQWGRASPSVITAVVI